MAEITKDDFKIKTKEERDAMIEAKQNETPSKEQRKEEKKIAGLNKIIAKAFVKNGDDAPEKKLPPTEREAVKALKHIDPDNRDKAMDLLKDAITKGKGDFAAALVKGSSNNGGVYQYSKQDLKEAYKHGMDQAAKQMSVGHAEKIHRAAGSIATAAGIDPLSHIARIGKNKDAIIHPKINKGGMAR